MNIAHLLLGSAHEFRDLPALARGTATHLGYRELWRKVIGDGHPGNAGADDGEIEILHAPHIARPSCGLQ